MDLPVQPSNAKVFVLDKNYDLANIIKHLLEVQSEYFEVVGIATTHESAFGFLNSHPEVDIVLVEGDSENLKFLEQVSNTLPTLKSLFFTFLDDPNLIYQAMKMGAKGYILKNKMGTDLIPALEEIYSGKIYLPPTLATKFFDAFYTRVSLGKKNDSGDAQAKALSQLTPMENNILSLLIEGKTYIDIARKLESSEADIKNHTFTIFKKLNVKDRTQAVLFALRNGFSAESSGIQKSGIYRHYKGGLYRVIDISTHSETLEQLVIYQALTGDRKIWTRPVSMFLEKVSHEGNKVPRFEIQSEPLKEFQSVS